jgi:DNA-directed RNA polymerase specialized sigma24 family protein
VKATTAAGLIEEMAPHVRRFVSHRLRTVPFIARQEVEDIVQDAMLLAIKAKKPCDPTRSDAEIRAWFWKVAASAISRFFNNRTAKKRAGRRESLDASYHANSARVRTPLEVDIHRDQYEDIMAVIQGMRPAMRDRLLHCAGLVELPPGYNRNSNRTLLGVARRELRERLKQRKTL